MDPTTKYYCRNVPSSAISSLSVQSPTTHGCHGTNIANNATIPSEYMACESNHSQTSATGFNCKDLYARSMNNGSGTGANTNKTPIHQRNGMLSVAVGTQQLATNVGTSTSTTGYCSNNSNNNTSGTGNYINVMPVSMGTLQYNRRKLTPQEYQSRLFYNSADYRCREDYYAAAAATVAAAGNARVGTASPSSSLQMHVQHHQPHQQNHAQPQQHHTQQLQAQPQQHHHHHLTQLNQQQVPQHYHNNMSQQQQQQQQQQHIHHSHHHHHQTTCPTTVLDRVDEALSCSLQIVPNSSRLMVATQTQQQHQHQPSAGNCEQLMAPTALSLDAISAVPPLMYTVHRVVTTAQIQTAAGNTFTSASSVSSVVSAVRNEADNIGNILTPMSGTPGSSGGVVGCDLNQCVNGATMTAEPSSGSRDTSTNINGNITVANICTSPGTSTNVSYLGNQTKQTVTPDSVRLTNVQYGGTPSLTNINYANNTTKTSTSSSTASSVSRPLQDVIPTCVYLMSRVAVHMEIEGTAQCPSQVMLAAALGCEELGIANKLLAQSIFGLWMASALLEIQLKSHHRPFLVRLAWSNLLEKFSHGNPIEKKFDEPMIMLKRNVFFSKRDEEKIKDHRILELLYEEAKHNVLTGRYVMEPVHSLMLGGIQARIELGPFNSHTHTVSFFRENQSRFLPQHVAKNSNWSWLPISRKNSAEIRLLEQFKRVPQTATTRKLMRKYLEFCWALPFYGAAFFHGQVEQPVRGLMSIVNHKDVEILIAVNERGVFIIDPAECTLLLGLRYEDLSWDFAKPSAVDDSECLTCIFLQFDAMENGIQISKLMQIFSRQAAMIDALISHFVEHTRKRKQEVNTTEQFHDEPNPIQNNGNGVLCNKLSRLTLATFDEEGRCIGQMGSLSISY